MFYSITLSPVINQLEITLERRLIKELTKPEQRQEQLGSLPAKPHNWYNNGSFLKVSLNMELGIMDRDGWMDGYSSCRKSSRTKQQGRSEGVEGGEEPSPPASPPGE